MRGERDQAGASDAPQPPAPRTNPDLLGHKAAEQLLRQLFLSGRLPHALLLSGPRGIGKATLAFRLARFVLAHRADDRPFLAPEPGAGEGLAIAPDSGTFRRVAAGGHADLLSVERAYDTRRRRLRSEIVVDDTRQIAAFLRLTPAEGGWRVVVIDGADEMNRNAANALLKILEEPPARALLLLVAHSPGRLLPTIRSRVRRFPLSPLTPDEVRRLLARYRPDLPEPQATALTALSGGSIGRALELAAVGGVELHETVLRLLGTGGSDVPALHGFADQLARNDAEDAYRAVEDLLALETARRALLAARTGSRAAAARWAELHNEIGRNFDRTDDLNLDRKQTILSTFLAIEAAQG